jgi:phage FluMu gp28-like protein
MTQALIYGRMALVAGVDVGRSRDYTAIVLMERPLVVRGIYRLQLGQEWIQIMAGIARLVQPCSHVAIDSTGVGSPIAEALADKVSGRVIPITFTADSKSRMMRALIAAISSRQLQIDPSAPGRDELREELTHFRAAPGRTGWRFTGKHHGGKDDLVMALALAIQAAGCATIPN